MNSKSSARAEIRTANKLDVRQITRYKAQILATTTFLLEYPSESQIDEASTLTQIEHSNKNGKILLVAEVEGEIVGMLSFGRSNFKKILHRGGLMMSIAEAYRGQGIGRALLEEFLIRANADQSLERIDLSVMSSNDIAIKLYENNGFSHEGRRKDAYKMEDGSYEDEVCMGLLLRKK